MLLDPDDVGARVAHRRRARRAARPTSPSAWRPRPTAPRVELATRRTRRRRRDRRARGAARRLADDLDRKGMHAAVAGTHPFASGRTPRSPPARATSSIYDSMRELARREPTFALHVHVARARRRDGGPRDQRPARAPAAAAGAVGQLAVLAGPRHGPRLRAHAGLQRVPAHRHPAPLRQLRGLRRGDRRAAALRRDPRADVPVVGRAPAAAARHDRGADHGRADPRGGHRARSSRSCSAWSGARRSEAAPDERRRSPRGARREPLPRHARRDGGGLRRPGARPPLPGARDLADALARARRTPSGCSCRRELASVRALAERPGVLRQRAVAARPEGLHGVLRAMHGDFVSPRAEPAIPV